MHADDGSVWGKVGKDAYIRHVLETYSQSVIRLCYTYVKNMADAEDLAQEVFLTLLKREKTFESAEHERAWILRTAANKSKNYLKSGWAAKTVRLGDAGAETHEKKSAEEKDSGDVREAVLSLPEKYRTVIHLFYYDGYTINEIAEAVHKKPATVGTLLARGRVLLKKIMIGGFEDE